MMQSLRLLQTQWEAMRLHVDSLAPMEACGLLAGMGDTVQDVLLVANREQSTSRFRMDAAEQLQAFRLIEEGGLELLGIFHSHPMDAGAGSSPAVGPSATDVREAAYPVVHVIWSRSEGLWQARGFWIQDGRITDVQLRIGTGE